MAIASAKAIPSKRGTNNLSALSGFLPMLSMALLAVIPIPMAGPIPPMAIVSALANIVTASVLIMFSVVAPFMELISLINQATTLSFSSLQVEA